MSEELKACPFCGSEDIAILFHGDWFKPWFSYCKNCYVETAKFDNESDAINIWNNHPLEDALRIELEEAQASTEFQAKRADELQKKLDVALTDLHDTTSQLVMDEEIEDALRKRLEIAVKALKDIYNWSDNHAAGIADEALSKIGAGK